MVVVQEGADEDAGGRGKARADYQVTGVPAEARAADILGLDSSGRRQNRHGDRGADIAEGTILVAYRVGARASENILRHVLERGPGMDIERLPPSAHNDSGTHPSGPMVARAPTEALIVVAAASHLGSPFPAEGRAYYSCSAPSTRRKDFDYWRTLEVAKNPLIRPLAAGSRPLVTRSLSARMRSSATPITRR